MNYITKGELLEILTKSHLPDTAAVLLRVFEPDAVQPADPKKARTGHWELRELVKTRAAARDCKHVLLLQGEVL